MIRTRLDGELQRLAKKFRCTYTRYADDITFSTDQKHFPKAIALPASGSWASNDVIIGDALNSAISSNGFQINRRKIRMQFPSDHQEVTGLTVNEYPNVGREYTNLIRAMLHAWKKFGRKAAQDEYLRRRNDRPDNPYYDPPDFGRIIRGKLDFLRMVKGNHDPSFRRLWNELHALDQTLAPSIDNESNDYSDIIDKDAVWAHWFKKYEHLIHKVSVVER